MNPIRSIVVTVGGRDHQFVVGDEKGPGIDGVRGPISKITEREHSCGREFHIFVSNDGISRHWGTISSHQYHCVNDIKSEL